MSENDINAAVRRMRMLVTKASSIEDATQGKKDMHQIEEYIRAMQERLIKANNEIETLRDAIEIDDDSGDYDDEQEDNDDE